MTRPTNKTASRRASPASSTSSERLPFSLQLDRLQIANGAPKVRQSGTLRLARPKLLQSWIKMEGFGVADQNLVKIAVLNIDQIILFHMNYSAWNF